MRIIKRKRNESSVVLHLLLVRPNMYTVYIDYLRKEDDYY